MRVEYIFIPSISKGWLTRKFIHFSFPTYSKPSGIVNKLRLANYNVNMNVHSWLTQPGWKSDAHHITDLISNLAGIYSVMRRYNQRLEISNLGLSGCSLPAEGGCGHRTCRGEEGRGGRVWCQHRGHFLRAITFLFHNEHGISHKNIHYGCLISWLIVIVHSQSIAI